MTKGKAGSLTAEAHEKLRGDIMACRLSPGQKLVIQDLCKMFGFSLGAIREALSRLTSEGLVEAEPRKGFRVAPITDEELRDITKVRSTIESLCLDNAIRNGDLKWETGIVSTLFELSRLQLQDPDDPERVSETWAETHRRFHEALVSACDSPWLLRLRQTLFTQSERYRRVSVPLDRVGRDVHGEHKAIADAAMARNSELACAELCSHLERTTLVLIKANVVNRHNAKPEPVV